MAVETRPEFWVAEGFSAFGANRPRWRVRRRDATGHPGGLSELRQYSCRRRLLTRKPKMATYAGIPVRPGRRSRRAADNFRRRPGLGRVADVLVVRALLPRRGPVANPGKSPVSSGDRVEGHGRSVKPTNLGFWRFCYRFPRVPLDLRAPQVSLPRSPRAPAANRRWTAPRARSPGAASANPALLLGIDWRGPAPADDPCY